MGVGERPCAVLEDVNCLGKTMGGGVSVAHVPATRLGALAQNRLRGVIGEALTGVGKLSNSD